MCWVPYAAKLFLYHENTHSLPPPRRALRLFALLIAMASIVGCTKDAFNTNAVPLDEQFADELSYSLAKSIAAQ